MTFELIIGIILSLIGIFFAFLIGRKIGKFQRDKYWEEKIPEYRKDAIAKSRAILSGNFSEQLSPYLPNFPFSPTECKFLGKPIDFIVFKGADEKKINEVIFVEVKSGKSKLNLQEKNLKNAIEEKKVKFVEYKIPEEITKGKNIVDE